MNPDNQQAKRTDVMQKHAQHVFLLCFPNIEVANKLNMQSDMEHI